MRGIPVTSRLRSALGGDKPDMTPAEMHRFISANASEASVLHYQTALASRVAHQAAEHVDTYAQRYGEHAQFPLVSTRDIEEALRDIAGVIRSSTFPATLINLCTKGER